MEKAFKIEVKRHRKTGKYTAKAVELKGCFTEGRTREDAINNLRSVVEMQIRPQIKQGKPIHLYGLKKSERIKDEIVMKISDRAIFRDPRTIPLSELRVEADCKERQAEQRRLGYTQSLPHSLSFADVSHALTRAGIQDLGGEGPHERFQLIENGKRIMFPVPRHNDITDYTVAQILKEIHMTIPEFNALLAKDDRTYAMLRSIKTQLRK